MIDKLKQARLDKLNKIKEAGINPYPAKCERTHTVKQVLDDFDNFFKSEKKIILAGRIRMIRVHGGLTFANLEDQSGKIQLFFRRDEIGKEKYAMLKNLDMGDFLEAEGILFTTKRGERTLNVKRYKILTKSLLPLPEKWYGLKDEEEKFRKRYLDIMFNNEVREMIEKKAIFWNAVREFHIKQGFVEVETPVLENTVGGADAQPFATHHNALDIDVYLRISAGELWQKRLMVAGFEKTFEIGRIFRNEGMSTEHLQDYTQCEAYWAYSDYKDMYKFLRDCYRFVAKKTFGTLKFKIGKFEIDLEKEWLLLDFKEEVEKQTGINIWKDNSEKIISKLKELKIKTDTTDKGRLIDILWKYCRKNIEGPAILINEPKITSPLAKISPDNSDTTMRFHFIIAGSEVGQGYSELNDPIDQKERFQIQQKLRDAGDEEAQMMDKEFIEALEYGMPPTSGHGFSERLFSFLMNKPIRECQIFPLMRPKKLITENQKSEKVEAENYDLGINSKQAEKILDKYIKDPITKLHCIESKAIMEGVAKSLNQDSVKWGIVGLLHDIDWELTKNNTSEHCIKAVEILENEGASDFLIETIVSHGYGCVDNEKFKDKERTTKIQHSLAASETLTGLIIASALVQPDKKLTSLTVKSLKKKFKSKGFAANCNREIIKECEEIGICLDDFLEIGLKSLQEISEEIGL